MCPYNALSYFSADYYFKKCIKFNVKLFLDVGFFGAAIYVILCHFHFPSVLKLII